LHLLRFGLSSLPWLALSASASRLEGEEMSFSDYIREKFKEVEPIRAGSATDMVAEDAAKLQARMGKELNYKWTPTVDSWCRGCECLINFCECEVE